MAIEELGGTRASASEPITVHVRLLDEGTDVWRPTTARLVGPATYELRPTPDYDAMHETWEFEPGTVVRCEWRDLSGGRCLVALRWMSGPPPRSDTHLKTTDEATTKSLRRSETIAAWIFGLVLLGIAMFFGVEGFLLAVKKSHGVITCIAGGVLVGVGAAMQRLHLLQLMGVLLMVVGIGLLLGAGAGLVVGGR